MLKYALLICVAAAMTGCASMPTCCSADAQGTPMLRHVVLFKFKEDTSPAKVREIEQAFAALPQKIDTIKSFEWGTNNSPEGLNEGLTHAFVVTFADEQGRAEYLPHPAHKEFVTLLKPHLAKAVVVDYVPQ